jgi:hypothetical protein
MADLKLARWVESDFASLAILRDLSKEEEELHERYTPIVPEALDRLTLFRLLDHNYSEWRGYVDSLLSAQPLGEEDAKLNLNRLLLNYLTCAYTIRQHFEGSLNQRFRQEPEKKKQYDDFIQRLCTDSWPTAFFFDFRGYVQHRGLGIGVYHRNVKPTQVTLQITCDSVALVRESRNPEKTWQNSKLEGTEGDLHLVPLLAQFHDQMLKSYGRFVGKLIFPELEAAADYYGKLTREAVGGYHGLKMIFSDGGIKVGKDGKRTTYDVKLLFVPNDLFREVGVASPKYL